MLRLFNICGASLYSLFITLWILSFINRGFGSSHGNMRENGVLKAEEELLGESLPLLMGSRLYKLDGLKPYTWYEVKISYPASIPACFSMQLKRGNSELGMNLIRRLLNTEKLIFRTQKFESLEKQGEAYVLVSVEPEGIVAIRHARERQFIIFNIVCNELLLGIPHKAWWVGLLLVLCLVGASIVPWFLPSYLLPKDPSKDSHSAMSKDS